MFSVSRLALLITAIGLGSYAFAAPPVLRVCADPANLPFSNMRHQGFENQLAEWIAHDLNRKLEFVWWPQRARFMEKRLKAGSCDIVMGIPANFDLMTPTEPYYRSTYVFVSRRDRHLDLHTLHDDALRPLRIGLHLIGDEAEYVPPARELVANGMLKNIVGYSLYGKPLSENPAAELIDAVAKKDVDVAVAWGPTAAYFASKSDVPLTVSPICQTTAKTFFPVQFDMSMGVKKGDAELLQEVNRTLQNRKNQIEALLKTYSVPLTDQAANEKACGRRR